jgi:hypothetical protein
LAIRLATISYRVPPRRSVALFLVALAGMLATSSLQRKIIDNRPMLWAMGCSAWVIRAMGWAQPPTLKSIYGTDRVI